MYSHVQLTRLGRKREGGEREQRKLEGSEVKKENGKVEGRGFCSSFGLYQLVLLLN